MISKIVRFLTIDLWRIPLRKLPRSRSILIRQLRIVTLAVRGFDEDKCQLRASALTFYSLLAIVPIVAMVFGIAKGFGIEKMLETQLMERLEGQEQVVERIIGFSQSLLEKTKGGIVAGIGVVLLFWTVIRVLSNIENSFNDIWGIKKSRSFARKFSDYLAIMLIAPVLIIMPGSITLAITSQFEFITRKFSLLGVIGPFLFAGLKFIPYMVIWIFLSFMYVFMPNTKVGIRSAVLGGVVAGTFYQLMQFGYINTQILVSRYGAIYGSFAALPLFLIWLQLSWLIVLLGAEISFAHQNVETYEFEPDSLKASYSFKKLVSLMAVNLVAKSFESGAKPLTAEQISHKLEIPIRLINTVLYELVEAEILSEVRPNDYKSIAYQPAQDLNRLTIKYVIDAVEKRGSDNIPVVESKELKQISESLKEFGQVLEKSAANILLKDI
ncbi:MAG: YihY/virulence factor BrkB family protein [Candidatus Ratteibacteria bacterium]|nr:YihY/virulence factor BrkB family protein [Candidatus Ratteibacteria bacterium]